MADEKFDVIVVGGGLAGLTSAYILAGQGLEVLLVERGNYSGAKNMTGGRLYAHSLEKVMPGFAEKAPVERAITRERLSYTDGDAAATVEYDSDALALPGGKSYSVLRGRFDKWFADEAEENGVMLVNGVKVDGLMMDGDKVCGVVAGDEEMAADVVILADGVNSLLSQKLGYKKDLLADQVAVGAKELIELDEATINQRFGLADGEGLAWMFLNGTAGDAVCDGFLYTNKNSVSLGITMRVDRVNGTETSVPQMLEDFKNSPAIAPLVEGGKLLEYSAHLLPEGGLEIMPRLYGDGVLLAGDAAALTANLGFTIRGMDLAIESGRLAAETVLAAKEKEDFSAETLSAYQKALEDSFVIPCMRGTEACLKTVEEKDFAQNPADAFNQTMAQALS